MLLGHALALSATHFVMQEKSPYEYVHSGRIELKSPYEYVHSGKIELTKLILVGKRIPYQATGYAVILI